MGTAPIKFDAQTDKLISRTAQFLGSSKKDATDVAVHEYDEKHCAEIQRGVAEALRQLDGSIASSVALISRLSREDLDSVGGVEESP